MSTLWVVHGHDPSRAGCFTRTPAGRLRVAHCFPRDHVNVGVDTCSRITDPMDGAHDLQRGLVNRCEPGGDRRGIGAAQLHACVHPGRGTTRRPGRGRVLLAGDAGGLECSTAEGIYYAMVSGELAAKSVTSRLRVHPARPTRVRSRNWRELRDPLIQRYLSRTAAEL